MIPNTFPPSQKILENCSDDSFINCFSLEYFQCHILKISLFIFLLWAIFWTFQFCMKCGLPLRPSPFSLMSRISWVLLTLAFVIICPLSQNILKFKKFWYDFFIMFTYSSGRESPIIESRTEASSKNFEDDFSRVLVRTNVSAVPRPTSPKRKVSLRSSVFPK